MPRWHPGYARLCHPVRGRNLPFTSEYRDVCRLCRVCAEVKPRFHRPEPETLVKATHAWECFSIDFTGPLKGSTPYLLVVVDEYSRFPFAFPCERMTSETVVDCLSQLNLFGFPAYIHSDRGLAFVSRAVNLKLFCRHMALQQAVRLPSILGRTGSAKGRTRPLENCLASPTFL